MKNNVGFTGATILKKRVEYQRKPEEHELRGNQARKMSQSSKIKLIKEPQKEL